MKPLISMYEMQIKDFFAPFIQWKVAMGASFKTFTEYDRVIRDMIDPAVGEITPESFKLIDVSLVIKVARDHGQYGPQRSVVMLRQLLRFISESGHKLAFDWREIKVPPAPRKHVDYLEEDEYLQVCEAFDQNTLVGIRDRAIVEVLKVSGLRISEALALNRDSIDRQKLEAVIRNAKPPHDDEVVYFTVGCINLIDRYLYERVDDNPALFVGTLSPHRLQPQSARASLRAAMKNAGVTKRIHPHMFRRTFGTKLLQSGVDIKSVQYLMRHKSERTTLQHYIGVNKLKTKEMHAKVMETLPITKQSAILYQYEQSERKTKQKDYIVPRHQKIAFFRDWQNSGNFGTSGVAELLP